MSSMVELYDMPGRAGITLRGAGDMGPSSAAVNPRRAIASSAGLLVLPQTHSKIVHVVDASWLHRVALPEGDGMVTSDPTVVLGVTVADCLPIYLASKDAAVRALVHSGWRGTGIAATAVDVFMEQFEIAPSQIVACIGPGICGRCYVVGQDVHNRFLADYGSVAALRRDGAYYVDLAGANEALLRAKGVAEVRRIDGCTFESERYSSYRRDGAGFCRMLAFFAAS